MAVISIHSEKCCMLYAVASRAPDCTKKCNSQIAYCSGVLRRKGCIGNISFQFKTSSMMVSGMGRLKFILHVIFISELLYPLVQTNWVYFSERDHITRKMFVKIYIFCDVSLSSPSCSAHQSGYTIFIAPPGISHLNLTSIL